MVQLRDVVEAVSQIDDCADDACFLVMAIDNPGPGPIRGALGIRFPEISAWTNPVEWPVTLEDFGVAGNDAFANSALAAVIPQDKRCGEATQATFALRLGPPNSGASLPFSR
jgi:hypothetical protein